MSLELAAVLAAFGLKYDDARVERLGNAGGMSGARLWRVVSAGQPYCLRQWPSAHPTFERLDWIHGCMKRARSERCSFVPQVLSADDGTIVRLSDRLWELTEWMPGNADFSVQPTDQRLNHAAVSLAQIHCALKALAREPQCSPGAQQRREMLDQASRPVLDAWQRQIDLRHGEQAASRCRTILSRAQLRLRECRAQIGRVAEISTAIQPCLRDVWHDHLLFTDQQVTGIVDYGAMNYESPAADLARMLGSLVPDEPERWQAALDAYQVWRPLSDSELKLLAVFDHVNPTLSGLNWIRWLYIENRRFESIDVVQDRLAAIEQRL